jgi:carbonic anhydrase/acetyltransferase-like protein (isoleucine patch superfamily)
MVIQTFEGKKPVIAKDAYVSPRASVIGSVTIGAKSSVWEHAVIRGDYNTITIGSETSVQDNCTVHCDMRCATKIGDRVTLGHSSVVHGCNIEDDVLVGIGAIILNGVHIGARSIIGAGCVVTPGTTIPPESMVLGVPGKVVRPVTQAELVEFAANAQVYVQLSRRYLADAKHARKPASR